MKKVIRTICLFRKNVTSSDIQKLYDLKTKFEQNDFVVQTIRLCSPNKDFLKLEKNANDSSVFLSIGQLNYDDAISRLDSFYKSKNVVFNVELSEEILELKHTGLLFDIIKNAPAKTFNFTHTFNNVKSSPYFPSAVYEKDGFAIGLQPTDLAENAENLEDWFDNMKKVWAEVMGLVESEQGFLGIDSSIAPLYEGSSSLINFIKRIGLNFNDSVVTDTYLKITNFIKSSNPKPIGLNGLMLPALEDFELADEYEKGNFSMERNIFLSLHSGLGIDTYPIGINESPERVLNILKTVQGLSNKYNKPLSVRFASDGKAKIGEKTDFNNPFLKDVVIRALSGPIDSKKELVDQLI